MTRSYQAALTGACLSICVPSAALADMPVAEPLKHAPIGLMGDHRHHSGEWMTSYRFMRMEMRGLRDGTNDVRPTDIFVPGKPPTFPVAPTRMTMDMHMLGLMYGWSDSITFMAMVPWLENEMDHHVTPMPANNFTTKTEGFGDVKLSALIGLETGLPGTTHITLGVSLPTGSIDEKGQTPSGYVVLPYPMQLGSGTYDALIGATWQAGQEDWAWGAQYSGTIRLGKNDRSYRLGNSHEATIFMSHALNENLSASARLKAQHIGKIDGADAALNPTLAPTADPDNHGGRYADAILGLNWVGLEGAPKGHRLAAEYSWPIHQDLNGPQMKRVGTLTLGWQKAF